MENARSGRGGGEYNEGNLDEEYWGKGNNNEPKNLKIQKKKSNITPPPPTISTREQRV